MQGKDGEGNGWDRLAEDREALIYATGARLCMKSARWRGVTLDRAGARPLHSWLSPS